MADLEFSKRLRLLNAQDFTTVFSSTEVKVGCPQLLILASNTGQTNPRLGLVIAKKHLKLATRRNRAKRVIRESFRHRVPSLPPLDIIVLARKGIGELDKAALAELLQKLWVRLEGKAVGTEGKQ